MMFKFQQSKVIRLFVSLNILLLLKFLTLDKLVS